MSSGRHRKRCLTARPGGGTASGALRDPASPADGGSMGAVHDFFAQLRDFIVNWWPLLLFLFYLLWRLLQVMPRVKPTSTVEDAASTIAWSDIAGADEAKAELLEIVEFLRDPKRFERLGAHVPKGVLLYGPPGTGKTLLAKAAANESGAKFYAQSASAFVEMFAGLGAPRIRKLFQEARKHAPAIIFIDELDAVGAARTGHGFNREQDQTLNQLLVELDGFGTSDRVVVLGASNRLQDLDAALLRPGRFDRQTLVGPPDLGGREAILHVHTRGKPLGADVDLDGRGRSSAEGQHRLPRCGARLHAQPPDGGSLHGDEGRARRHDEDRARRARCGAGGLRARHQRRRQRPREGDGDREVDGVR